MQEVNKPFPNVTLSDSNDAIGKFSTVLLKVHKLMSGLTFNFSFLALDHALKLFHLAREANLTPQVIELLENDEGLFLDFTRGESYFAFELYNDGDIISLRKNGTQNSTVQEFNAIHDVIAHLA